MKFRLETFLIVYFLCGFTAFAQKESPAAEPTFNLPTLSDSDSAQDSASDSSINLSNGSAPVEKLPAPAVAPSPLVTTQVAGKDVPTLSEAIKSTLMPFDVFYKEQVAFSIWGSSQQKPYYQVKAKKASGHLAKAFEKPLRIDETATQLVHLGADDFQIVVNDEFITKLKLNEMASTSLDFEQTKQDFALQVDRFYQLEAKKMIWQSRAKKFFISFFALLIGIVLLSQLKHLFDRAEKRLEEKRETLKPIAFMSEVFLTQQTLGGVLAFSLILGRFLAYFSLVLFLLFLVLNQFEASRAIGPGLILNFGRQTLTLLKGTLEGIPGILLALILLVLLQACLKFLKLLSRNMTNGKFKFRNVENHRLPVLTGLGSVIALLLFVPLIISSFFSYYFTPTQIIFLCFAAAFALSLIPLMAQIAIGSFYLWCGEFREGLWISINGVQGEIVGSSITHLELVPFSGGRIKVAMWRLFFDGYTHLQKGQIQSWQLKFKRGLALEEVRVKILNLFPSDELPRIVLSSADSDFVTLRLSLSQISTQSRADTELVLDNLCKNQDLALLQIQSIDAL